MNLLENIPSHLDEELTEVLVRNSQLRIERIVSTGQASPKGFWYDQTENEWILLLQGSAELSFDSLLPNQHLSKGDSLLIKAHQKHRVESTSEFEPTIWLAIFFPGDEFETEF